MHEYKAEKCTWTAESSRMRACVQLGLLFLSVLISSIYGEETDQATSMEGPMHFDMEDFQVAENEQEQNLLSHDSDTIPVNLRVKRQDNGKRRKGKKTRPVNPGTYSMLGRPAPKIPVSSATA